MTVVSLAEEEQTPELCLPCGDTAFPSQDAFTVTSVTQLLDLGLPSLRSGRKSIPAGPGLWCFVTAAGADLCNGYQPLLPYITPVSVGRFTTPH